LRNFLVAFVFLTLIGCASSSLRNNLRKEQIELKESLSIKDEQISKKEEQIKKLEALLIEKETEIREKDTKIEELKSKLSNFGVF